MMFRSDFSKRLIAYLRSPKKYIVNVSFIAGYYRGQFTDVEVIARSKKEAKTLAEKRCMESISITAYGIKSMGRVKTFKS